jgi:hypothetical protein
LTRRTNIPIDVAERAGAAEFGITPTPTAPVASRRRPKARQDPDNPLIVLPGFGLAVFGRPFRLRGRALDRSACRLLPIPPSRRRGLPRDFLSLLSGKFPRTGPAAQRPETSDSSSVFGRGRRPAQARQFGCSTIGLL